MDLDVLRTVFSFRKNGGRRLGIDRRQFSYHANIPESRSDQDRRIIKERRNGARIVELGRTEEILLKGGATNSPN